MSRQKGREEESEQSTQITNGHEKQSEQTVGRKQKVSQSQDERRKIRTGYRKLITDTCSELSIFCPDI
jgi:hypothetical protein